MPLTPKSLLYALNPATAVATITLNRPERLNALTFEVYTELRDTFRALDAEPGVRAIVITGTGRAFCSGGDVEDIIGALFSRDADPPGETTGPRTTGRHSRVRQSGYLPAHFRWAHGPLRPVDALPARAPFRRGGRGGERRRPGAHPDGSRCRP